MKRTNTWLAQVAVSLFALIFITSPNVYAHHGDMKLVLDIASNPQKVDEISTQNLKNLPIKLSDFQGKVIFLNFWATWCVPCKKEMPDMKRLEKKINDPRFVIVTVNMQEPPEKIQKFYEDLKFSFITMLDPDGKIFERYRVNQLPITYIISKQGFVVARAAGPRNWASQNSIDYFTHLLNEKTKQETQEQESFFPSSLKKIFGR